MDGLDFIYMYRLNFYNQHTAHVQEGYKGKFFLAKEDVYTAVVTGACQLPLSQVKSKLW